MEPDPPLIRLARVAELVATRLVGIVAVAAATGMLLASAALPLVITADAAMNAAEAELFDHPPLPDELPAAPRITHLHDRHGEPITEVHGPVEREPVPLDEVADVVVDAVLATEDAEFYEHDGVNHDSIVRAGLRNVTAGRIEEGASTITQQLVTLEFLEPEPTIERKLQEIVWAVELEKRLDKDEILDRYLNRIYLGHGLYGIGTAADYYFSKAPAELELAEAALLAGAIRSPVTANPVDAPETAATRRDVVLHQMAARGFVDEAEIEPIVGSEVELSLREEEPGEPFWEDLVKRVIYDPSVDLQPGLQEAVGASVDERVDALFEGGLTVTTTLDSQLHQHATATIHEYVSDPVEDPMGSLITVDHTTGAVRAMALGPKEFGPCEEGDEPCTTTQVNPAAPGIGGSGRQSGSSFKPFVSAAAFEQGEDTEIEYETPSGEELEDCGYDEEWEPENFDLEDHGEIEMPEAMRRSTNVYFAKLSRDVGVRSVVETAMAHGLTHSPNLEDFGEEDCSIGLGTAEIFPWEMVAGYGVWANDGEHCEPYIIDRIEDRDGEVLYEHDPECRRATDPATAADMRELLGEPTGEGGTAAGVGATVPEATGKTGTTDNFHDAWFVGSARGHTTAAWVGFEQPRPMREVTLGGQWYERVAGGTVPAPMWADLVAHLPEE